MTTAPEATGKLQRSFTGDKLDWMSALSADPRLDSRAFEVGFQIAQHVNRGTGVAILSDETISDKTGIPVRWVARARASLRKNGWIDWRRTKTANIYWTRGEKMNSVADWQISLKEAREERRNVRKAARQVLPPVAYLKQDDRPPVAIADLPPVAERDRPPVADIHLSSYTVEVTPSKKEGFPRRSLLKEGDDGLDIPGFLDRRHTAKPKLTAEQETYNESQVAAALDRGNRELV